MRHGKAAAAFVAAAAICVTSGVALAQQSTGQKNAVNKGPVTIYTAPAEELQATSIEDIGKARPMPLPLVDRAPADRADRDGVPLKLGKPGVSLGQTGTGKMSPVTVPVEDGGNDQDDGVAPQEFGTANHPFTTARVDTSSNNVSNTFPFRAAGKLYFNDGGTSYVCSASLIKRGIIVTAAHCVAAFGEQRFYTNWQFVPAKFNAKAPYGTWNGGTAVVMTSYYNGTDVCAPGASGVVCQNDVAVISMVPKSGAYPGTQTGWLSYGWNGYGFTPNNLALINQLGYPVSHDSGNIMHRTDSQGNVDSSMAGNTVWGSRQTGGSSGGPETVNLGVRGSLSTPVGSEPRPNTVVGVTSWGYVSASVKEQGASPFRSTNIVALVNAVCASNPACQ
jgi:V8-like Glu-specific endopeptidase